MADNRTMSTPDAINSMTNTADPNQGRLLPGELGFRHGDGLAFVLGAFRGGTTLMRKMIDSHPQACSPAETWFMLPMLNMWDGQGEAKGFNHGQAAAAIKQHLQLKQFISCAQAFAARFYAETIAPGASIYVDKTPMYLKLAGPLADIFPKARFIVLHRDPRSVLWARHTWRHSDNGPIEQRVEGVVADTKRLAAFASNHPGRSHLVSYERLCMDPAPELARLCGFLGIDRAQSSISTMINYGAAKHHEGYGDENTRSHQRPHTESVSRWRGHLPQAVEHALAQRCGVDVLRGLGYLDLMQIAQEHANEERRRAGQQVA